MTVITCSSCGLRQWVPVSGNCRRCRENLGFSLTEITLSSHSVTPDHEHGPDLRFGPALRAMRLRQGRTQQDVSLRARMQRSSLSRVESSRCAPSLSTLARILRALGAEALYIRLSNSIPGSNIEDVS
jgi:DNA-binding XRE family transcriptional regulator